MGAPRVGPPDVRGRADRLTEPLIGIEQQPSCIMGRHRPDDDRDADEQEHAPDSDVGKLDEQTLGL